MSQWGSYSAHGHWRKGHGGGWQWQWPQPHGQQQQRPHAWTCLGCQQENWTPKTKCSQCGLKKSWAQVVAGGPGPQQPQPSAKAPIPHGTNAVRSQLDQVAALVSQSAQAVISQSHVATTSDSAMMPTSGAPPTTSPAASASSYALGSYTKAQLAAQIKSIEAAMAHLPDEPAFSEQRASLLAKADALKQERSEAKPIGARIDGARARLERAQKRRAEAVRALELAQDVVKAADAEVDKIAAELEELESALAKAPAQPGTEPATEKGHVQALREQLCAVLTHLKANPRVDPALVNLAEAHSAQLLQGFQVTLSAAESVRLAGDNQEAPKTRARVKTTLLRAVNANRSVRTRVIGKRTAKVRALGDFFPATASSKAKLTLGGGSAHAENSEL